MHSEVALLPPWQRRLCFQARSQTFFLWGGGSNWSNFGTFYDYAWIILRSRWIWPFFGGGGGRCQMTPLTPPWLRACVFGGVQKVINGLRWNFMDGVRGGKRYKWLNFGGKLDHDPALGSADLHTLPSIIVVACPDQGAGNDPGAVEVGPISTGRIKQSKGTSDSILVVIRITI